LKEYQGHLDAAGKSFAIVASRFNDFIVEALIRGAHNGLLRVGAATADVSLFRVPGALEIPAVAARLSRSGRYHAVICLGAVVRGATPHFEYVAGGSTGAVARLAAESPIPVVNGILTTDTVEQAIERAGTKAGNKGEEAALAAVELIHLYESMK
jgi:6,7-dimethyl-8-ribityllumazine synthase